MIDVNSTSRPISSSGGFPKDGENGFVLACHPAVFVDMSSLYHEHRNRHDIELRHRTFNSDIAHRTLTSRIELRVTPIIKWAGGKRRVLDRIVRHFLPLSIRIGNHFWRWRCFFSDTARAPKAQLSDSNHRLISTYQNIRSDPHAVIHKLKTHFERHSPDYYYAIRDDFNNFYIGTDVGLLLYI